MKRFLILVCLLVLSNSVFGDDDDHEMIIFKKHIEEQCGFTRYPNHCIASLLDSQKLGGGDIILSLVQKIREATTLLSPGSSSSSSPSFHHVDKLSGQQVHQQSGLGYCFELMELSLKHLNQSLLALQNSPRGMKNDIQTWLSAVLTFQHACKDSIQDHPNNEFSLSISTKMAFLSRLTSNSLALVNRITHDDQVQYSSPAAMPGWMSRKGRKLLQTTPIRADAVVAKDGTGNYRTVSEAIKAASGGRFVIYVKTGVYNEKIRTNKDGITLIGDGKYSTIITYHDSVKAGSSMPYTATFAITGDGFMARDIGFQNTAGPYGDQALALSVVSDRSVFFRCSIVGYQDTLYALALRQFYRDCDIYGTIDFIFGNAAAIFQSSIIALRKPKSGSYNVILANGREDPGQNTGFTIQRCRITVTPDLSPSKHSIESYLGRPWKQYSRSIIMQSFIDDAIRPRGWVEWTGSFALKTLYFAEYLNQGPGAGTSSRVKWNGYHVIGPDQAMMFTVSKFIGGTAWLPSTGVNFVAGLN
ncbi:hypothetical protein Sjap_012037 [Stephania japonica]|uniref:Pectinesterase n=1 Tax=Stephania japonica TaxID=461633 RepID=A0AAP0JEJ2_9MAGN